MHGCGLSNNAHEIMFAKGDATVELSIFQLKLINLQMHVGIVPDHVALD